MKHALKLHQPKRVEDILVQFVRDNDIRISDFKFVSSLLKGGEYDTIYLLDSLRPLSSNALLFATRKAISFEHWDDAMTLMEMVKERGFRIRPDIETSVLNRELPQDLMDWVQPIRRLV